MIARFVARWQAEVTECEDGHSALANFMTFRPDWVLMDWEMVGLSGLSTTRLMVEQFPEARIVFVTNFDGREMRLAAFEAGAVGYVVKDDLIALEQFLAPERDFPEVPVVVEK